MTRLSAPLAGRPGTARLPSAASAAGGTERFCAAYDGLRPKPEIACSLGPPAAGVLTATPLLAKSTPNQPEQSPSPVS